ncbi:MAG: hypothetical protein JNM62_16125 [Flavobacteriales bacterium]|nr:hypothetical protein [Flavobacteriales bacterium]
MASTLVRFVLLIACYACTCTVVGQGEIIRKLKSELATDELNSHERARKLERLSWYLCGADPISAMEAAQEAMAIAERINDPSLLGSAIVRKVAAKQTASDRTGDAEDLERAVGLLKKHGPERDLGYAYWCLFMELSEVAGQDSLCKFYNQKASALFERHNEATGRYWVLLTALFYNPSSDQQDAVDMESELERTVRESHDTCLIVGHYSYAFNKALAVEHFAEAERIANEHLAMSRTMNVPFEEFGALLDLQSAAAYLGDHEQAIRYGLQMLEVTERLRMTTYRRWVHSEIATRFADLDDHASAMEHLQQALAIDGGPKGPWDCFQILLNLGRSLLKTGQLDTALVVLHDSERLFTEGANGTFPLYESTLQAFLLQYLGTAYRQKGDLVRSRTYLEHALRVTAIPNMRMDAARVGVEHARTLALGNAADRIAAIAETDSVIALAAREGWLEMTRDARLALYEAYHHDGNVPAALQNLRLHIAAKDSLISLERIKNINALNKRFESERKDAELRDLSVTNTQQGEHIGEHRRRNVLLASGIAVAVLVAVLLFVLLRNARRSRALLAEKNATILEAQARLVESERAREASEVRTRIARDVHDQLGSDLTKLVMLSTEAKEVTGANTHELASIASDIERIAGEANRSLGDIVWAIDPPHDSLAGLTERVRAHCERMLKWSKVEHTVDCVHDGPDRSLDPATKRDIYLMLREALNNAIKYAKATHIDVQFHSSVSGVRFLVRDDGVGLNHDPSKGHGMANMQARATRISGLLAVESQPGMGTAVRFRAELPLEVTP